MNENNTFSTGSVISNRYEIIKFLGAGGMASVYVAKDTLLEGSLIALKILHDRLKDDSSQYQRFLREVQLTRLVTHPNVVRTFDISQHQGCTYFTMEYVDGVSLDQYQKKIKLLPIDVALYFTLQICQGLHAIHQCDIIHRDLKPPNIMIVKGSLVKITDFGVARPKVSYLTDENNFCGTLPYVAPEVFSTNEIVPATDCYSLGISLFEMLTGTLPFMHEMPAKLIAMHLQDKPPLPSSLRNDIPEWIDKITLSMLAKNPEDRPSISSLIARLSTYLKENENLKKELNFNNEAIVPIANLLSTNIELTGDGTRLDITANCTKPNAEVNQTQSDYAEDDIYDQTETKSLPTHAVHRYIIVFCTAIFLTLLNFACFYSDFSNKLDMSLLDCWFSLRGVEEPSNDILIVSLNERSYDNLGIPLTQAWPRNLHAKLLNTFAEYHVKRVVFDILFLGESTDRKADLELAQAIKGIPTVLGSSFMLVSQATLTGSYVLETYNEPYEPFLKNAAASGLVNFPSDFGRIRRFNIELPVHYSNLKSLAEMGSGVYEDTAMPLPNNNDLINFYGPSGVIKTIPYETILEEESPLPRELLKDKIVVVGLVLHSSAGPNQKEEFESPFNGKYIFGSEIHATAISNILLQDWIKRLPSHIEATIICLLCFLATFFILISPLNLKYHIAPLFLFIWAVLSFLAFIKHIFIPGTLTFLIIIPAIAVCSIVLAFIRRRV